MTARPSDATEHLIFCRKCDGITPHRIGRPDLRPQSPVQQGIVMGRSGSVLGALVGGVLAAILGAFVFGQQWHCLACSTSRRVGGLLGGKP